MFCGMVTIGGARGLHDRRSGRSVVGLRLLHCNNYNRIKERRLVRIRRSLIGKTEG